MDFVLGLGVFGLGWYWLRSLRLSGSWALGGAVLIAVVGYPLLISLLVGVMRALSSMPLWGAIPMLLGVLAVGVLGYWLGRSGFLADDPSR